MSACVGATSERRSQVRAPLAEQWTFSYSVIFYQYCAAHTARRLIAEVETTATAAATQTIRSQKQNKSNNR